jgi:hypothetical protein
MLVSIKISKKYLDHNIGKLVKELSMSDKTKAILFFILFLGLIPILYLAPTILNALTDLFTGATSSTGN